MMIKDLSAMLTGSDLHESGLGTTFVKFSADFSTSVDTVTKTQFDIVIKPDQRIIEKSLLSDQLDSLANKFNEYHWSLDETDISGESKIRTIPMKTSSEYKQDHSTIIKKIIEKQQSQSEGTNPIAQELLSAFKEMMVGDTDVMVDMEKKETRKDFQQGQLPFYTYWYSTGLIKHNNQTIAKSSNLDEMIDYALQERQEGRRS